MIFFVVGIFGVWHTNQGWTKYSIDSCSFFFNFPNSISLNMSSSRTVCLKMQRNTSSSRNNVLFGSRFHEKLRIIMQSDFFFFGWVSMIFPNFILIFFFWHFDLHFAQVRFHWKAYEVCFLKSFVVWHRYLIWANLIFWNKKFIWNFLYRYFDKFILIQRNFNNKTFPTRHHSSQSMIVLF